MTRKPAARLWRRTAGCLVLALTPLLAHAGVESRQWCRLSSDHFDLVTDLGERKSVALLLSLDRFRAAAYAVLPGRPLNPPAAPRLLVFKRSQDFAALFEFPHIVGFMRPALEQSLLAFGPDHNGRHLHAFAYHEYTHFLLRSRTMLNLPIWYEEGLASYLASLSINAEGFVTLGRGPHALLRYLVKQPELPIQQVLGERFRLDWQRHDLSDVYTLAWGLVRFLHHAARADGSRYAEDIGAMLEAVDAGATSLQAIEQALGVAPAQLHPLMRAYYDSSGDEPAKVHRFKVEDYEAPKYKRDCLNDSESRYVLAQAVYPHHPDKAAVHYDAILQRDPRHIGALLGRSRIAASAERGLEDANAAAAIAPDDPAVNVRIGQLHTALCELRPTEQCPQQLGAAATAYHRALAAASHRADAAYGLGLLYLLAGQPEEALEYLLAAHFRAPWSPRINYYLGEAHRLGGDVARARAHLNKTANWHPDEAWRQRANRALEKLGAEVPAAVDG